MSNEKKEHKKNKKAKLFIGQWWKCFIALIALANLVGLFLFDYQIPIISRFF